MSESAAAADPGVVAYPGAQAPARRRFVDSGGLRIAVHEWGDEQAPPLLLAHGGFDFARTYDVFAPLLAAGGYRVVSWDQRGHGDSEHAALYTWDADVRDALNVLESVSDEAIPVIGHSKGGSLLTHLADACPHSSPSRRVMTDFRRARSSGCGEHERRAAARTSRLADHRRRATAAPSGHARRVATRAHEPASVARLVALHRHDRRSPRRRRMALEARSVDALRRFRPWRPEWTLLRLPGLPVPMLGFLASISEPMCWDTTEEILRPHLPPDAEIHTLPETGHFIHIGGRTSGQRVLRFLA
jgi:pimeloyl-ACP methyl ester carboxylesterase